MNKRIEQLSTQAVNYARENFGTDFVLFHKLWQEKFAELIIQDCIDCVDGYTKPRTFDTHYDAVEQIKANFGFEL